MTEQGQVSVMDRELTRFTVVGLHGSQTMDVHLQDNKLVLVGENGAGKSTFANLIYYFLTKQWHRLTEYRFSKIEAQFGDQHLELTPEHLHLHDDTRRRLAHFMRISGHAPPHVTRRLLDQLLDYTAESVEIETDLLARLGAELHLPYRAVKNLLEDLEKTTGGKPIHLKTLEHQISELEQGQFLYLPTYRRIEQDLRSIFRGVPIESELRRFEEHLTRRSGESFIELVEFGMEDVERTITARMASIKESVREGLDNLTGTYLRDVIRGAYTKVDVQSVGNIDSDTLDAVFARIDEVTLPTADKDHLKKKVAAISTSQDIKEQDKVIAHFLSKLIQLYAEQQANERSVRDFVTLCNQYLTGKEMVYDNAKYTIFIAREDAGSSEEALEMKSLSSGEKQIVSLFSHLYLSGERRFFVIIDEPELSLSVPWQRQFLPDILGTGMCSGLIAVTHSPFVWDNSLEPYVRALAEFTAPYSGTAQLERTKGRKRR